MQAAYSPTGLLVLLSGLAAWGTAYAQDVALPAAAVPATTAETPAAPVMIPTRGALMTQVQAKFGMPAERHAAVGNPPITRWDYPEFSVFFEHEHVIHAVVR